MGYEEDWAVISPLPLHLSGGALTANKQWLSRSCLFAVAVGCLANQLVVSRLPTNQPLLDPLASCPYEHLQAHPPSIQTHPLGSGSNTEELALAS